MTGARGERFLDLVAVMDQLRSPGGCPWDARQTHASLVEYLVEETYELVEAIETGDDSGVREELGDLLLQVVFHARIGQENLDEPWDIDTVCDGIINKLVSRHPHVFAGADATTADAVEVNWHALKAKEKGRNSVTDGIPAQLPALILAGKVISRSAPLSEQLPALETDQDIALVENMSDEQQLGEHLLALVSLARARGWDAEGALRAAVRHRVSAIQELEKSVGGKSGE
ncbi:MAG: MazG family protein [Candidatus Nanopelagicales bacterium]|nr:MazG family protein [Candidatus Nanopelagicales bacterium]